MSSFFTPNRKRAVLLLLSLAIIVSVAIRVARREGRIYNEDDIIFTDTLSLGEEHKVPDYSESEIENLFNF